MTPITTNSRKAFQQKNQTKIFKYISTHHINNYTLDFNLFLQQAKVSVLVGAVKMIIAVYEVIHYSLLTI